MNFLELLDAAQPYLKNFDYDHYPANFSAFEQAAAPFFASLTGADHAALTAELLAAVEARWAALPRFRRSALAKKDKTVLALFFTPAAARHSETAGAFSEQLRRSWNARFPRNSYLAGDYEKIVKGFDTDFFGLTLRNSKQRS